MNENDIKYKNENDLFYVKYLKYKNENDLFYIKYLKYKNKYLQLKEQYGNGFTHKVIPSKQEISN